MPQMIPKRQMTLPDRFEPRFWEELGEYLPARRVLLERYERLCEDAGVDSIQKELIAQRAVFLSVRLETMEVVALRTGKINGGQYTQAVNSLVGLLRSLGLERHIYEGGGVEAYLKQKERGED